jgi:Glycosyltransferase family 87
MSSLFATDRFSLGTSLATARHHALAEWRRHPVLWCGSAVLLLLTALYVGRGLRYLVSHEPPAVDLQMRWLEQRYIYNGQNPYDVVARVRAEQFNLSLPESTRNDRVDPRIGKPYQRAGGYPPWAFPTAALFVLPAQWDVTTTYFGVVNVLALMMTFVWAYQIGRSHSLAGGVFLGAAALAVFGNSKALQAGQYGVIINGLLIGSYWLTQQRKQVAGGILWGMSLLKPQISALFALGFLVKRQWRALALATAYVVLASLVTWVMTKTNPIEMLGQMYSLAQGWVDHPNPSVHQEIPIGCNTFSSVLLGLHVDRKIATPLAALLGLFLAGVLMWVWRNGSTLALFAIAATVGRLWSYHRPYDDAMLIFLIVALGKLVLSHRSLGTVLAFSLVGLTVWAPAPNRFPPLPLQVAIMTSWLFGLAILLTWEPRSGSIEEPTDGALTAGFGWRQHPTPRGLSVRG